MTNGSGVTLSPILAKEVARALRIQLACELDRPFDEPLPSREDAAGCGACSTYASTSSRLLAWGEPSG